MGSRDVEVVIGATPELAAGLNQARQQLDAWAKGIESSTAPAAKGVSSFSRAVQEYVREERGQDRMAGFFVRKIAEVVPVSAEAKNALTNLGGAFLGGGIVGIGIAAGTTALSYLIDKYGEAKKAAKEATEAAAKAAGEWAQSLVALDTSFGDQVAKFRDFAKTPQQRFVEAAVAPINAEIAKKEAELEGKRAELASLNNAVRLGEDVDQKKLKTLAEEADVLERTIWNLEYKRTTQKATAEEAFPLLDAERRKVEALRKEAEELAKLKPGIWDSYVGVPSPGMPYRDTSKPTVVINPISGLDEIAAQNRAAADVFDSTRTAAEKYDAEIAKLNALLSDGVISQDTFTRAMGRAAQTFAEADAQLRQFVQAGVDGLLGLGKAAFEGDDAVKKALQDMVANFDRAIEQMLSKWIIQQLMQLLVPGSGAALGGGGESPGIGPVQAPEEIGPAGKMTPSGVTAGKRAMIARGGTRTEVHLSVAALDAESFDHFLSRNEGTLANRIASLAYKGRLGTA